MSVGYHVSRAWAETGTISAALSKAAAGLRRLGFDSITLQIFVAGPQSYKQLLSDKDKKELRALVETGVCKIVVHGAYVDYPWKGAVRGINNIKKEMCAAADIGAGGVIVHLGSGATDDGRLRDVLGRMADLPADVLSSVILWLEINAARPSATTFETPEKLGELFRRVGQFCPAGLRVGLCVDTAHLCSCGVVLSTAAAAEAWLKALPPVPVMFHLNDSYSAAGSGVDRHIALGRGTIWGRRSDGLDAILRYATEHNCAVILERAQSDLPADLHLLAKRRFCQGR